MARYGMVCHDMAGLGTARRGRGPDLLDRGLCLIWVASLIVVAVDGIVVWADG
jgi:hypothetical protein